VGGARECRSSRTCTAVIRVNALHPLGGRERRSPVASSGPDGAMCHPATREALRVAGRHWSAKDTQNGQYFSHFYGSLRTTRGNGKVPRRVHRELGPTGPNAASGRIRVKRRPPVAKPYAPTDLKSFYAPSAQSGATLNIHSTARCAGQERRKGTGRPKESPLPQRWDFKEEEEEEEEECSEGNEWGSRPPCALCHSVEYDGFGSSRI
jgi:hypothetical protein